MGETRNRVLNTRAYNGRDEAERAAFEKNRTVLLQASGVGSLPQSILPSAAWLSLDEEQKNRIFDDIVKYYIGPKVLAGERNSNLKLKLKMVGDSMAQKNTAVSILDVALSEVYLVVNQDEFLTH